MMVVGVGVFCYSVTIPQQVAELDQKLNVLNVTGNEWKALYTND